MISNSTYSTSTQLIANSSFSHYQGGVRGGSDRFSTPTIDNSLMRSGLALAGANTWKLGGDLPPEAGKGFLFAQDVAVLDLWANVLCYYVIVTVFSEINKIAIAYNYFNAQITLR